MPEHETWLTLEQAAQRVGVTKRTIREWISRGELPAHRVGPRLIRVRTADIDQMLTPITPSA